MSVSASNDMLVQELNGFLRGVAVFSSMFVKTGGCVFIFKKTDAKSISQKMLKPVSRESLAFELDRWFAYGLNDFMAPPEEKLAAAYHREIQETASDARVALFDYLNQKIFGRKDWEVLYAEEKIEDAEELQDEYLFRSGSEVYYLRLGWTNR